MDYNLLTIKAWTYVKQNYIAPVLGVNASSKQVLCSLGNYGYSFSTYKDGRYYIVIDRNLLFEKVKPKRDTVLPNEFRQNTLDTMYFLMALFYHEFGHVQYTCFNVDKIYDDIPKDHIGAAHMLMNVLEDPFIEMQIKMKIRKSRKFLNFLVDKVFAVQTESYEDTEDFRSFATYLLLCLRLGKAKIKNSNKFFDDHTDDINNFVRRFYSEPNGEERLYIAKEFYQYLVDQGMDMSQQLDESETSVSRSSSGDGAPDAEQSMDGSEMSDDLMDSKTVSPGGNAGGFDPDSPVGNEGKIHKDSFDESKFDPNVSAEDYEAPTLEGFESYDSFASATTQHEFEKLKDITNVSDRNLGLFEEYYNNTVAKFGDLVNDCMDKIDSFESVNEVYPMDGYSSGKFSMKTYTKGESLLKCFTRPSGPDVNPDLCFYLLVDGSGSMAGTKSNLCTQALIILYECLTRLNIPFEFSTFATNYNDVYGSTAVTYILKSFDDDPALNKTFTSFTDYDNYDGFDLPDDYDMFSSNVDEVNLTFCGQRLLARENRNKVMIVLSDGDTCGSREELIDRVKELEDQGVLVLGVGICSNSVTHIYNKHVVFSSSSELENFPEFLGKFLVDLYTE